eukprot:Rhum_TRINITY_DN10859_c0_g1::Rhum_TRINITY_DN10859_c0_g1_i1::g.40491::m.40491
MGKGGFLTKGRIKRKPLPKGHFSQRSHKQTRIQKPKAPSRFISNADKADGPTADGTDAPARPAAAASAAAAAPVRGGARHVYADGSESDSDAERHARLVRREAERQRNAQRTLEEGNRKTRRLQLQRLKEREEMGITEEAVEAYKKGVEAEGKLSKEEWDLLCDAHAERQGGWMKYNYLTTHPSWNASKARRRTQEGLLSEYGIAIFDDAAGADGGGEAAPAQDAEEDTEMEGEEEGEEEVEEEEDEGEDDIVFPSFQPRRAIVSYVGDLDSDDGYGHGYG